MAKEQSKLTQEVQERFWFLFGERGGQIVANKDTGQLSKLKSTVVTVAVDGLLFRFVHWRDNRQVHVASERLPDEWHELSAPNNGQGIGDSPAHSRAPRRRTKPNPKLQRVSGF